MKNHTMLEDFVQTIYQRHQFPRKPAYQHISDAFRIEIGFNAPFSCIDDDIILIEKTTPEREREILGHELGHFLRDYGHYRDYAPMFYEFIEYKATNFMYHFCVPSFLLMQDELPFCRAEAMHTIMERYGVTKQLAQRRLDMHERKLIELNYY